MQVDGFRLHCSSAVWLATPALGLLVFAYQQIDWKPHYSAVCVRTQTIDRLMQLDLPAGVDVEVKL